MRFPVKGVLPALALGAAAVLLPVAGAQSAGVAQPAAFRPPARIDDIQVSEANGVVSILVKLSTQPTAASGSAKDNRLTLEIDGVTLAPLAFDPAPGSLLSRVSASGKGDGNSTITLEGAAFGEAATTIYRNAVLIEAKLADPTLSSSASLMPGRTVAAPASPLQPAPLPAAPAPVHAPAPIPAVSHAPAATPKPVPGEPVSAPGPAHVAIIEPVVAPATLVPEPNHGLESHAPPDALPLVPMPAAPAPAQPAPASPGPATKLARIDGARCTSAETELKKDAWALGALGDHALCLIDAKKLPEAANRIGQLAAFAPEDWRVALGRAVLDQEKGDASRAIVGYRNAAMLAPDADVRAAINLAATALTHD